MKWLCIALAGSMTIPGAHRLTVGQPLPELKGKFLTGRKAVLPGASSGRAALLLLGFSYDSRFAVEAWTKRFRDDFGTNPQVAFYEIPMIGGMARMGKWLIDGGMRRGTPKADHEHVITVYGGTGSWKEQLGVTDEKHAYLILLDPQGKIAWLHSGPFEEMPYRALAENVQKLASGQ